MIATEVTAWTSNRCGRWYPASSAAWSRRCGRRNFPDRLCCRAAGSAAPRRESLRLATSLRTRSPKPVEVGRRNCEATRDGSRQFLAPPDRFGDLVRKRGCEPQIPGAVLLIQQPGSQVYLEKFRRSAASRPSCPMTPDTIFRIYSMSKAVTSVAIMMLAEDGKLSIDDPVSKYIPAFADTKVASIFPMRRPVSLKFEPQKRPITILDLCGTPLHHLRLLWRRPAQKTLCEACAVRRRFRQCRVRRSGSRNCGSPISPACAGLWPFHRHPRPRVEVVSDRRCAVEKAMAARSAGHARDRILCCRQGKLVSYREPLPAAVSARRQGLANRIAGILSPKSAAALGIRRGGHGLDGAGLRPLPQMLLNGASWTAGLSSSARRSR